MLQQCCTDSGEKIWDRYVQRLMDYVREYVFSSESAAGICKENLESILSEVDKRKNLRESKRRKNKSGINNRGTGKIRK